MQIDEKTLSILSQVRVEGNIIRLQSGQLERKQYEVVNEVLENMGGKWNRKAKGHLFDSDPTTALEQVLLAREIISPKKYGYFPTPPELVEKLIELAVVHPHDFVLEPSAGRGAIADKIPPCAFLHCIELLPENASVLRGKGYLTTEGDFLSMEIDARYDRVIMNPPFENQADIDHVLHAWKFVRPGGRLVSIMASGVTFRLNRKTKDFRQLIDRHGFWQANPDGSFNLSGTMVGTVTVVLNKRG